MATAVDLRLPVGRASAGAARHAVDGLVGRIPQHMLESVRLLVSELVTNSFRHARLEPSAWIGLRVDVQPARVRVEVSDPGPGFDPVIHPPTIFQESGWGLYLVERIAQRWGVDHHGATLVWFEVDLTE